MSQGKARTSKDADMSPFEAARKLLSLEANRLSLGDQIDHVFQDMDLVPLLIQVIHAIVQHSSSLSSWLVDLCPMPPAES